MTAAARRRERRERREQRLDQRRAQMQDVPVEDRASALKERVYASFTGLAIVTVFALDPEHTTARDAFLALVAGIVGISLAGFVAEIIGHLVAHGASPTAAEIRTMGQISSGAIASASIPLLALACAWIGFLDLLVALQISIGIYLVTLGGIALIAALRTGLSWRQRIVALLGLVGLGSVVVAVLVLAH